MILIKKVLLNISLSMISVASFASSYTVTIKNDSSHHVMHLTGKVCSVPYSGFNYGPLCRQKISIVKPGMEKSFYCDQHSQGRINPAIKNKELHYMSYYLQSVKVGGKFFQEPHPRKNSILGVTIHHNTNRGHAELKISYHTHDSKISCHISGPVGKSSAQNCASL